jgi:hypothetical protein
METMRRFAILTVTLAAAFAGPPIARAGFTVYTDRPSFLAAAGTVSTETFDEFTSGKSFGPVSVIGGVTYATQTGVFVFGSGATAVAESPPNLLFVQGNFPLTMTPGSPVTAFGFAFALPPGALQDAAYGVSVFESNGVTTTLREDFNTGGARFLGFVETGPPGVAITAVEIAQITNSSGNTFAIGVDDVTNTPTAVPEPGSLMLAIGGAGMLLALRGRKYLRKHRGRNG